MKPFNALLNEKKLWYKHHNVELIQIGFLGLITKNYEVQLFQEQYLYTHDDVQWKHLQNCLRKIGLK